MYRSAVLFGLVLLLTACGSSKNAVSDGVSPSRIDVTELSYPAELHSAYDIVRRHKSNWLRKRGRSSISNPTPVKVYLDDAGSSYGGVNSLKGISGMDVATIEYFNPGEAQLKFGAGNNSGAILVHTRDGSE